VNTTSRSRIVALLLGYALLFIAAAHGFTQRAISIVEAKGTAFEVGDLVVFGFVYTLLFNLLVTLPLLMVVGYRGIQVPMVIERVRASLALCGLSRRQIGEKMHEYAEHNGFRAFVLPIGVNLAFMVLLWGAALFPHGVAGMMDHLEDDHRLKVAIDLVLLHVSREAVLGNWMFFGAYFYAITTLIRRWMQSDLTTGVLWKLNVRFAVTILLGLLFMALFAADQDRPAAWVLGFAFLAGMVPDILSEDVLQIDAPPPPLSRSMLENLIEGLENGPNLKYLCNYWERVSRPPARRDKAPSLPGG
jgi:hypothetical protein